MSAADLFARYGSLVAWVAATLAMSTAGAVIAERTSFGLRGWRRRRFEASYAPLVRGALAGDAAAERALVRSPRRLRLEIATLLILPLVDDRDPRRIARSREIVAALSLLRDAERMVRSYRRWRRAAVLRAFGLLQIRDRTAWVVAALDDPNMEVRTAALDALADLHDPASLDAIVVRLFDTSLPRGRRIAALTAFGGDAEPLLLDLAELDPVHRVRYARALAVCGTALSRPALCRWAEAGPAAQRAAAFTALAHVGVDGPSAHVAIDALDAADPAVRAAAAHALQGCEGSRDAAVRLASHLNDEWIVASQAARALQSIGAEGQQALRESAARADLAGLLARQMLWELRVSQ